MNKRIVLISLALIPALAQAHPGHGTGASFLAGGIHPLAGADHLMALIAAGLLAWRMGGLAQIGIALAFPVLLAMGALLGLAGLQLAITEVMIMLSIAVLGLLALKPQRQLPVATICLSALFALFHGHAHGLEAADGLAGSAFVAGMTLSSALVIGATLMAAQRIGGRAGALQRADR